MYATALRKAIDEQGLEAKSNGSLIVEKIWSSTIKGNTLRIELSSKMMMVEEFQSVTVFLNNNSVLPNLRRPSINLNTKLLVKII